MIRERHHRPLGETRLSNTLYPAQLLTADTSFTRALTLAATSADIERIQSEFAALCNRLISADCRNVKSRDDLKHIVRKACGYLSIGLHALSAKLQSADAASETVTAELIQRHLLEDIFRVGYARALRLKWKAQQWLQQAWFASKG